MIASVENLWLWWLLALLPFAAVLTAFTLFSYAMDPHPVPRWFEWLMRHRVLYNIIETAAFLVVVAYMFFFSLADLTL